MNSEKKRNMVADYDAYIKACMDSGVFHSQHSLVNLGTSYVMITSEGAKTIEWSDVHDVTNWD